MSLAQELEQGTEGLVARAQAAHAGAEATLLQTARAHLREGGEDRLHSPGERRLHPLAEDGQDLGEALKLGVRALNVTQNKTLSERDLEIAVLDRTKTRRKFRRIPPEAVAQLLGTVR